MTVHGKYLAVNPNQLYIVADVLTKVAADYTQAAKETSDCNPPEVTPRWPSIVGEWSSLRLIVSDILRNSATNLTDTATGLNQTAKHYVATDREVGDKFNRL